MSRGQLHDRSFAFSVRDSDPSPVVGDVPQGIVSQSLELDRSIARSHADRSTPRCRHPVSLPRASAWRSWRRYSWGTTSK